MSEKVDLKDLTVDNIGDAIKQGGLADAEIAKEAMAAIEKANKDRKKEDLIHIIKEANYLNQLALLNLRRARAVEKASKERITSVTALKDQVMNGKIPIHDYQEEGKKVAEEYRKAISEADKLYDADFRALNADYPNNYSYRRSPLYSDN